MVGFGRIGRAVAKRALAFEMTVIAFDPYIPADVAADLGVELVDLDTLFGRADFITLHALLTDETREMINAGGDRQDERRRAHRRCGARRADQRSRPCRRDQERQGGGRGARRVPDRAAPADNPLIGLPGVVHTPHLAASTEDAQIVVAVDAAKLVVDGLLNGKFANVVNPDVLA